MSAARRWGIGVLGVTVVLAVTAASWSQGAAALQPVATPPAAKVVPASSSPMASRAGSVVGLGLVSRTYEIAPRPAVYSVSDGYSAGTAPGERLHFRAPAGKVILSVGTRVELSWAGYTSDLPDAMGTDSAAQAVQIRDMHPVRLDQWDFEVVNPYLDCRTIVGRVTGVACTGWRVQLVVTAVIANAAP